MAEERQEVHDIGVIAVEFQQADEDGCSGVVRVVLVFACRGHGIEVVDFGQEGVEHVEFWDRVAVGLGVFLRLVVHDVFPDAGFAQRVDEAPDFFFAVAHAQPVEVGF